MQSPDDRPEVSIGIDSATSGMVLLVLMGIALTGIPAYFALRQPPPPASAVVAADPLLLQGRTIFLDRCISCHGPNGKGDGPLAKNLTGPPVGDLTISKWKHGDKPEEVRAVIAKGIDKSQMPGWLSALEPTGVNAVAAYVYHLAGREVPQALRTR